jgi:lipopolysaccharide export LptBFGC system permease protein LptF
VELNQRLAMPLGALLLCLMAMPLGLRPGRHGRTWGLVLGLVLFLVYYVIFTASWRLAVHAAINPRVAPWLADLVFVGLAAYLWRRTVQERPLLPESWLVWGRHWTQKVIALTKKIISMPNNR